jgi:hypothetical protein
MAKLNVAVTDRQYEVDLATLNPLDVAIDTDGDVVLLVGDDSRRVIGYVTLQTNLSIPGHYQGRFYELRATTVDAGVPVNKADLSVER